ncbi:YciI family protein [Tumebacillus permanentifrigoris]|uniref:YCII-related domain-containing protein n=1 Tax=Tumebacillus permanentifrigoris TaxID=378543 RepID=A0A316DRC9_9BACL|nr:YciI family protein [Tumebacillus permanentifrigoris]PWK07016.1 YCII-related domain-containing protein [Tumebacillus permanentifrigoris]
MDNLQEFVYLFKPKRDNFFESMTPEEMAAMGQHVEYSNRLFSEGKIVLGGACTNGAFGIIVFRAESPEAAQEIFDNDPAVVAGVVDAELHPYRVALLQGR